MEQPLTPPDPEDFCEVCGRQCSTRVCRDCKSEVNNTDRKDE